MIARFEMIGGSLLAYVERFEFLGSQMHGLHVNGYVKESSKKSYITRASLLNNFVYSI